MTHTQAPMPAEEFAELLTNEAISYDKVRGYYSLDADAIPLINQYTAQVRNAVIDETLKKVLKTIQSEMVLWDNIDDDNHYINELLEHMVEAINFNFRKTQKHDGESDDA